jgi:predicted nucleic acid-binding protein
LNVLVDTSIWSLALRRRQADLSASENRTRDSFAELIREARVLLIGPVRQELLSGIRDAAQFYRIRNYLRSFENYPIDTADYEQAAQMSNLCRTRGVAKSSVDMIICAIAHKLNIPIFTTDKDYLRYSSLWAVQLFAAEDRVS